MRRLLLLSGAFLAVAGAAHAGTIQVGPFGILTVSAQSAIGAASSPFLLDNPGTTAGNGLVSTSPITIGAATVTFSPDANTPQGGIYAGNTPNIAASPFNGTQLTPTNYFVAEPNDPVKIAFNSLQTKFDLLWGTVDTYNALTIQFCLLGVCVNEATVTGSDVASAAGGGFAADGTSPAFVELSEYKFAPFDEIMVTSTGIAAEFVPQYVPEPISLSILGTSLVGLGFARRRRTA